MNDFECPKCGEDLAVPNDLVGKKVRCQKCDHVFRAAEDLHDDDPDFRPGQRMDRESHRGTLVLTLGIVGLCVECLGMCCYGFSSLVGGPLGLTAWILGHKDLNAMKAGNMDRDGGETMSGYICGIIATSLAGLWLCLALFVTIMMIFAK